MEDLLEVLIEFLKDHTKLMIALAILIIVIFIAVLILK